MGGVLGCTNSPLVTAAFMKVTGYRGRGKEKGVIYTLMGVCMRGTRRRISGTGRVYILTLKKTVWDWLDMKAIM